MTPLFIVNLGRYDYGLWEMIMSVIGYMGMLDLGLRPAISRYAAKFEAVNDQENLKVIYSTTCIFMAVIGIVLCISFVLWGIFFGQNLGAGSGSNQRYVFLLFIIGVQLLFVFPGVVAESYLEGFQKHYLRNNITIFNSIVSAFILYFWMTPSNGLLLLAGCNALGMSTKYVVFMWILSRQSYGGIKANIKLFSRAKLKEMLMFSSKSFIQGISTRIENGTDSLVIGSFLGPVMVPFYSIPANLVFYIRTFGWSLTHAFMPLFSGLNAVSETDKIKEVYLVASKYLVALILAVAAGICVVGGPFIVLWVGPDFRETSDLIIVLLVLFTAGPFVNPFSSRYLTAIGKHGIFARFAPVSAIINLGLSLILVHYYGIYGVAFASAVPIFIFVPIYLRYVCKNLELAVFYYLKKSVFPSLLPAVFLVIVAAMFRIHGWLLSYPLMICAILLSATVWVVAFWLVGLKKAERIFLVQVFVFRKKGSYPTFLP